MTLKCWLCANTGERVGKGMARHKLQPQPTACVTVAPQTLGCRSTHHPSPNPGIAHNSPMNLPLQLSSGHYRCPAMMPGYPNIWPNIQQEPGKEGAGYDRTMKCTVVVCSRNDQEWKSTPTLGTWGTQPCQVFGAGQTSGCVVVCVILPPDVGLL